MSRSGLSVLMSGFAIAIVLSVALAFRIVSLERRPMHGDEANQAYRTGTLLEKGSYRYDPDDHHGPSLYYLTLPFLWLTGTGSFSESVEWQFRIVPALFGVGLIFLLFLATDGLGRNGILWAALLTAVSPAMVFYSRYYIQETLLVFFSFAALACGWRYARSGRLSWAISAGACLGMMHATKETCVIVYAAMSGALALNVLTARLARSKSLSTPVPDSSPCPRLLHVILGLLTAAAVSGILFSSFLTHPSGIWDSLYAYGAYWRRGFGETSIHRHPWSYYLGLLAFSKRGPGPWWSEGMILALAVVGACFAFTRRQDLSRVPGFARFLVFYTGLLTLLYSAIPYKTPWCLLGFLHGMILLAGLGAEEMLRRIPRRAGRIAAVLILAVGAAHLVRQAYYANFVYEADVRNPYVYAHTSSALLRLVHRVEDLAAIHPDGYELRIDVIARNSDYWPLPWYLRRFTRVGYWTHVPAPLQAPVIIAHVEAAERIEAALEGAYHSEYHALRPGVLLLAYIRRDVWDRFIQTRVSWSGSDPTARVESSSPGST